MVGGNDTHSVLKAHLLCLTSWVFQLNTKRFFSNMDFLHEFKIKITSTLHFFLFCKKMYVNQNILFDIQNPFNKLEYYWKKHSFQELDH